MQAHLLLHVGAGADGKAAPLAGRLVEPLLQGLHAGDDCRAVGVGKQHTLATRAQHPRLDSRALRSRSSITCFEASTRYGTQRRANHGGWYVTGKAERRQSAEARVAHCTVEVIIARCHAGYLAHVGGLLYEAHGVQAMLADVVKHDTARAVAAAVVHHDHLKQR